MLLLLHRRQAGQRESPRGFWRPASSYPDRAGDGPTALVVGLMAPSSTGGPAPNVTSRPCPAARRSWLASRSHLAWSSSPAAAAAASTHCSSTRVRLPRHNDPRRSTRRAPQPRLHRPPGHRHQPPARSRCRPRPRPARHQEPNWQRHAMAPGSRTGTAPARRCFRGACSAERDRNFFSYSPTVIARRVASSGRAQISLLWRGLPALWWLAWPGCFPAGGPYLL